MTLEIMTNFASIESMALATQTASVQAAFANPNAQVGPSDLVNWSGEKFHPKTGELTKKAKRQMRMRNALIARKEMLAARNESIEKYGKEAGSISLLQAKRNARAGSRGHVLKNMGEKRQTVVSCNKNFPVHYQLSEEKSITLGTSGRGNRREMRAQRRRAALDGEDGNSMEIEGEFTCSEPSSACSSACNSPMNSLSLSDFSLAECSTDAGNSDMGTMSWSLE